VPLRKEVKDCLTRQVEGMQNIRGLHRKVLAERKKKECKSLSERALDSIICLTTVAAHEVL